MDGWRRPPVGCTRRSHPSIHPAGGFRPTLRFPSPPDVRLSFGSCHSAKVYSFIVIVAVDGPPVLPSAPHQPPFHQVNWLRLVRLVRLVPLVLPSSIFDVSINFQRSPTAPKSKSNDARLYSSWPLSQLLLDKISSRLSDKSMRYSSWKWERSAIRRRVNAGDFGKSPPLASWLKTRRIHCKDPRAGPPHLEHFFRFFPSFFPPFFQRWNRQEIPQHGRCQKRNNGSVGG